MSTRTQTAAELVSKSTSTSNHGQSWSNQLNTSDKCYLRGIVIAMKETPGASHYIVARNLKKELDLSIGIGTIAKTLKELIADDQKNSK